MRRNNKSKSSHRQSKEDVRIVLTKDSVSMDTPKKSSDWISNLSEERDSEEELSDEDVGLSTNYAKRLMLVNGICGLNIEPVHSAQKTAFGARNKVPMIHLPGAEGFGDMLEDYMREVKGEIGRSSKSESKLPMDLGKWPSRAKPNPKAIETADVAWLPSASKLNTSLISSQNFLFISINSHPL